MATLDMDGYTDLPNDKIGFVVTFLEMTAKPEPQILKKPDGVSLERWVAPKPDEYLRLFRQIGDDWLWFGRLRLETAELEKLLSEPSREIYVPMRDGKAVGLLELSFADPANVELSYFGLVPQAIGGGVGRWLIQSGIERVWSRSDTQRFWLHTCTGDSPQALGFYMSNGFSPYKRSIEVTDDPRVIGVLEPDLGRHIPKLS